MEQVNLLDIYRKLNEIESNMATKKELNEAMETILVLSNEDTLKQIKDSEKDIDNSNCKEIDSVDDL